MTFHCHCFDSSDGSESWTHAVYSPARKRGTFVPSSVRFVQEVLRGFDRACFAGVVGEAAKSRSRDAFTSNVRASEIHILTKHKNCQQQQQ